MKELLYLTVIFLAVLGTVKILSFFYVLWLKAKLKNANLATFIKVLGEDHKLRKDSKELTRYKWSKRFVIIKANFDRNGNLTYNTILTHIISKGKSELFFLV
jgi:hypothetical protein